jgi:hypothetical protein
MNAPGAADPLELYRRRLDERRAERQRQEGRDFRLSMARGAVALAGLGACAVVTTSSGGVAALAITVLAFGALVLVHERTARALRRAGRAVAFYEQGVARLNDEWAGRGDGGARFLDAAHPYAADLDLFGHASLFQRLSTARTRAGEETLAAWLLSPAPPEAARERQAAVAELRDRIDLREDLAVLGAEARQSVDSPSLRAWIGTPVPVLPAAVRVTAVLASLGAFAALWHWWEGGRREPFLLAVILVIALARWSRRWTVPILRGIDQPSRDLDTLSGLLARLEEERVSSPLLRRLWEGFAAGGRRPSREIERLSGLVVLRDSQRNIFFAPIAFLLLWDVHVAAAVSAWRRRAGTGVNAALGALGEIEALGALAAYHFENPADPFPSFVEDGPLLEAQALGHPLLPASRAVRNDVRFDAGRRLLIVSGSNMSGKSTFLRTVGINTVLAQAGAPVRAGALRLSPLAVGASIRIQDSLHEGRSGFYAEITRVRQIMDLAGTRPWLLFLLDEIFHGTNSADRLVGAEAVVRELVRRGAIGMVTSHDLALTRIAEDPAALAANVHFEDHLEGDTIAFDYRLKPGPVTRSNAIALMRAVGLEV